MTKKTINLLNKKLMHCTSFFILLPFFLFLSKIDTKNKIKSIEKKNKLLYDFLERRNKTRCISKHKHTYLFFLLLNLYK